MLLVPSLPAAAIVNGVPDDGEHPYVGQLLYYVPDAVDSRFDDPGGWFTCTGTLLDETTVLTAGHCVYGIGTDGEPTTLPDGALSSTGGTDVWINFLEAPDYSALPPSSTFVPDGNDERYDAWSAVLDADPDWRSATAYHHPEYDDGNFVLHDLGVLVLDEPAPDYATSDGFGVLPEVGLLDRLARVKGRTYEPVGYGLEESGPLTASGGDTRRKATQKLVNLNGVFGYGKGTSAKFSNNQGTNTTGGTCSGDSGGPVLAGDTSHVIVAVTSFGINPTCTGSDGAYRVDQADDLAWLATFGVTAP
ncbi:trypsin-like serine protease [Aquipuribacter nitratireducens]|uniref:Trypsin-like serine protease n=1 Tax=Aquipuribacter nitratireducens TaxID=650104 RepID=A0ABW0GJ12_9MICO